MHVTGEESLLFNIESSDIYAYSKGSGATAVGMMAQGAQNVLVNADRADVYVGATGENAQAAGMAGYGDSLILGNLSGADVQVRVEEAGAKAAGMAVEGNRSLVLNGEEAEIHVKAAGEGSSAQGIVATGSANLVLNLGGDIRVAAAGEGSQAAGMWVSAAPSEESDPTSLLLNGGKVRATANGAESFVVGAGLDGRNAVLLNLGTLAARASGEDAAAAGVAIRGSHQIGLNNGFIKAKAEGNGSQAVGVALIAGEATGDSEEDKIVFVNLTSGVITAGATGEQADAVAVLITADEDVQDPVGVQLYNFGVIVGDIRVGEGTPSTFIFLSEESETYGNVTLGRGGDNGVEVWAGAVVEGVVDGNYHKGDEHNSHLHLTGDDDKITYLEAKNFRTVHISGGQWVFYDDAALDLEWTDVANGSKFVINRTYNERINVGELTLRDGARLEGDGVIRGNVTNVSGILAPGHSPDVITIVGNYTHEPDAIYEVEVTRDGEHDQLNVRKDASDPDNTGKVTLNGGSLLVKVEGTARDHWNSGVAKRYEIFTAENAVVKNAELGIDLEALHPVYFRAGLTYEAQAVILELLGLRFEDVARTHNEKEVARVLDGTPEDHVLVKAMYSADTEQQARHWLNQLSGEIYTVYPLVGAAGLDNFRRAVDRGMASLETTQNRHVWFTVYSNSYSLNGGDENADANFHVNGGVAGVDVMAGERGRLGVAAGFTSSKIYMDERASDMSGDGHHVGLYGEYNTNGFHLSAVAAYGHGRYDTHRRVTLGNGADRFDRSTSSRFEGDQWLVSVRGEGSRPVDYTVMEPLVGLSWLSISREAVSEKGGGEADLELEKYETSYVRGGLGVLVRWQPTTTAGNWTIKRTLWAAYVHDFSSPEREVTARFRQNPERPMAIRGVERSTGGIQIGLALSGVQGGEGRLGWNLQYEGEFRSELQDHSIHAGLSYRF